MAVVTISREFGSEGNYIGIKVAEALGYHSVFKKEINKVFEQFGISTFEKIYYTERHYSFWSKFEDMRRETMEMLTEVIRTFAYHGNVVIIGRCGYAILGTFTDVFNVRIQAPLPIKVERIMKEEMLDRDNAKRFVQEEDSKRARILQLYYSTRWDRTSAFDMVINTGKVPLDSAASLIVEAVQSMEDQKKYNEPSTRRIKVDSTLREAIAKVLES